MIVFTIREGKAGGCQSEHSPVMGAVDDPGVLLDMDTPEDSNVFATLFNQTR